MELAILIGVLMGLVSRVVFMRTGPNNFPTWPHGTIIHLFLGFVASVLGALSVVALLQVNVTAGVFLGIGAGQFHTLRDIERSYLAAIDKDEVVPRGTAYIEGMAAAFEAREFLVFLVAAAATVGARFLSPVAGLLSGLIVILVASPLIRGRPLAAVMRVSAIAWEVQDGWLTLDGIRARQLDAARDPQLAKDAFSVSLTPRHFNDWMTLRNSGQQQAIRHDFTVRFGCRGRPGVPWPVTIIDPGERRLLFFTVPEEGNRDRWIHSFSAFTVIETAHRPPRRG